MNARNAASQAQIDAARPQLSTWLSANAGSGKTRVLTDRVARLLLDGVPPENILCLTYTKAAASEMQNRLFQRLGDWAMKDDAALTQALLDLGVERPGDLNTARRLFARAIETPGGLKIQTIHSFCAGLLRRFPLEAGVTPNFTEMDDRAARVLRDAVVDDIASGKDAPVLRRLALFHSGEDLAKLTQAIASARPIFASAVTESEVWRWFGLPPGFSESDLPGQCFDGTEKALIARIAPILRTQSKTMQDLADLLESLDLAAPGPADMEALFNAFLLKNSSEPKLNSVPTVNARKALGLVLDPLIDFMHRVAQAKDVQNSLYSARKTLALHEFSKAFLTRYEAAKRARGWVDFDDQIQKAGALLSDPSVAAWVLYRLDGRIDHVLVDEAQDTSPEQWRVIEAVAREFTAGESARSDRARTLFVVGDPKQSIYSFQGAEPAAFSRMRAGFADRFQQVGQQLQRAWLEHSFRSAPILLDLVDTSLRDKPGLGDDPIRHSAFREFMPGRVDLWPPVEKADFDDPRTWFDTSDATMPENHAVRLARDIGAEIARMLKYESIQAEIEEDGKKKVIWRRVEPGDILILVRRRTDGVFDEVIRACKTARLPIAGADQLRIGAELAVKDLTALLRFLATPEDDLSLAAVLRSPLFGLSEAELYTLAQPRPDRATLWSVLRDGSSHPDITTTLRDLRDSADFLRPYDLIDRVLVRHQGRARLLARLGAEAEDGIDALLAQALAYERLDVPSLTGFLVWLDSDEVTVKRQMDNAGNQIRVMTVHGAKGLEAPIVFLPDSNRRRAPNPQEIMELGPGRAVWRPNANQMPRLLQAPADAARQADFEEWIRLLYVAMTRAGQWLIVAAAGDIGKGDDSWHAIVQSGMEAAGAAPCDFPTGTGLRLAQGDWRSAGDGAPPDGITAPGLPDWVHRPAPTAPDRAEPRSPSDLGGAKVLPVEPAEAQDAEAGKRRGRMIHRLLEHLPAWPERDWSGIAATLLAEGEDMARPEELGGLVEEAGRLLRTPDLSRLFADGTLAEVALTARIDIGNGPEPFHGIIDRLIVAPDHVLAVDFKTNARVPERAEDTPEGLLRQMAAYRAMLAAIYPDLPIKTALLWTRTARLMPLPDDLVAATYRRLDAVPRDT